VTTKKKKGGDEEDSPLPKKKRTAKAGGDGEEGEEISGSSGGKKMAGALALSEGNRAVDATAGLSLIARRLSWQTSADLAPSMGIAGQGKPPNYKGVPAPGATFDVTAYPLAFSHEGQAMTKNIGVIIFFDRALLISSQANGQKLQTASVR